MYMGYTLMSIALGSGLWPIEQGETGVVMVGTALLSCLVLAVPCLIVIGIMNLMFQKFTWPIIFWGCALINVYVTVA
jgi:hypothetical protein